MPWVCPDILLRFEKQAAAYELPERDGDLRFAPTANIGGS
jgi:hypothetical protein